MCSSDLSGALYTSELQAEVKRLAGHVSTSLCGGAELEKLLTRVAQASDIPISGKNDPTKECDGISFGFGYLSGRGTLIGTEDWTPGSACP